MTLPASIIANAIDQHPFNMGVIGSDWLASPNNLPITFANGDIALFEHEGNGDYEVHFLFVARGRAAIEHARQAFNAMFKKHGAKLIFGLVPDFRRDVKLFARWIGAKSAGVRSTTEGLCELFVVSPDTWKGMN